MKKLGNSKSLAFDFIYVYGGTEPELKDLMKDLDIKPNNNCRSWVMDTEPYSQSFELGIIPSHGVLNVNQV
jgi:hypothetical protein